MLPSNVKKMGKKEKKGGKKEGVLVLCWMLSVSSPGIHANHIKYIPKTKQYCR